MNTNQDSNDSTLVICNSNDCGQYYKTIEFTILAKNNK